MPGFKSKKAMAASRTDSMGRVLEIDEGRVYGARYHTVKPVFDFSDIMSLENVTWRTMTEWCVTTYGPTPEDGVWTPSARWYVNNAKFWFRNEKDLTMFILRWS